MLRTSLTGLQASSKNLSVISNNLANASTNGFKRSEARFADIINEEAGTRPGVVFGKGVSTLSIERTTAQGSMMGTSSSLDFAVDGAGYFIFGDAPDGETTDTTTYSRAGRLSMDRNGNLVDDSGAALLGSKAVNGNLQAASLSPINLVDAVGGKPETIGTVTISSKGLLTVTTTAGANIPVSYVALGRFASDSGLKQVGSNKLMATDRSGEVTIGGSGIDGLGSIKQGTIEKSNVDLTSELMQMIQSQQAYNGNSRALQTGSEMMRSITELIS